MRNTTILIWNRFAYETDNQFRAERRFSNGTVAGFYGFIGADGKPVRVKYGAVDELGFQAVQEIIPEAFPETSTDTSNSSEEQSTKPSPTEPSSLGAGGNSNKQLISLANPSFVPIINEADDSISVDAADYLPEGRVNVRSQLPSSEKRFVFPLIEVPDVPKKRTSRQMTLPEPKPIEAPRVVERGHFKRRLVIEKHLGEPAIVYADPSRYIQTVQASYNVAE